MPFLRIFRDWSQRKDITIAQFSKAWLLAQKPFLIPFPGTTSHQHLAEILGALAVKFTVAELKEIRAEIEKFKLLGVKSSESRHSFRQKAWICELSMGKQTKAQVLSVHQPAAGRSVAH